MFKGLSAWFSSSVSKNKRKKWQDSGGLLSDQDTAQFVFSQDATVSDMQRLFESTAYLDEHLCVFHANFIPQCLKVGDVKKVPPGKYLLPPKEVQDMARKRMNFQWDMDGNGTNDNSDENERPEVDVSERGQQQEKRNPAAKQTSSTSATIGTKPTSTPSSSDAKPANSSEIASTKQTQSTSSAHGLQQKPSSPEKAGGKRKSCTSATSGKQQERSVSVTPGMKQKPSSSAADKTGNEQLQTFVEEAPGQIARKGGRQLTHSKEDVGVVMKENPRTSTTQPGDDRVCRRKAEQEDYAEMLRLADLAKVTGVFEDFIVGENGCEVFKKRKVAA